MSWHSEPVTRVSKSSSGAESNGDTDAVRVAGDGRYVFFRSGATNLIDGQTTSGYQNLYRHDRQTGQTLRLPLTSQQQFATSADGNQVVAATAQWDLLGGDVNPAASFDGRDDQVSVPHDAAFNLTGDLTIEAWVRPWAGGVHQMIATKAVSNGVVNSTFEFRLHPNLIPEFLQVAGGAFQGVAATTAIPAARWTHLAVVKSGTTVTHYVNGQPAGSGTISGAATTNTTPVRIGARDDGYYFGGRLDEVAIYPWALAPSRVLQHVQARTTSYASSVLADGPRGYWRLGEAAGATSAADSSGNGRSGSYLGGPFLAAAGALAVDQNEAPDVFLHNLQTGATTLVALTSDGAQPNAGSSSPAISADGKRIAFLSSSTNMVPGDTSNIRHVYARDLVTGQLSRESVSSAGLPADGLNQDPPAISADGRYVAFQSDSWNLIGGDLDRALGLRSYWGSGPVLVPHQSAFDLTGNLTIEAWVVPTGGNYRMIATKAQSNGVVNNTFEFRLNPSGVPEFLQVAGNSFQAVGATSVVPANVWTHLAVVKSGTTVTHYVNGQAAGSGTISGAVSTNTAPVRLGGREDGYVFEGTLDEASVYGSALPASRILQHYQARTTNYADSVRADVPRGYWRLGEPSGSTTAVDSSGNGRSGTYATGASLGWRGALSNDSNDDADIFVRDRDAGRTTRVSVTSAGGQVEEPVNYIGQVPPLSGEGRHVAWVSSADLAGTPTRNGDTFVHDRLTALTTRESVSATGAQTLVGSSAPGSLSRDGRYLAINSAANNLLGGDGDPAAHYSLTQSKVTLPAGFANFTGGLTIEAWIRPTNNDFYARVVDLGNGAAADNIVFHRKESSNTLGFTVFHGGNAVGVVEAPGALELYKWQHVAVTLTPGGVATIYKNGVAVASGSSPLPNNLTRTSNYIGKSNWSGDGPYRGSMDEVAIYPSALTAAQVLAHVQARTTTYAATTLANAPLGYWRLGESSGSTATDYSGPTAIDSSPNRLHGSYNEVYPTLGALGVDDNGANDVYVRDRLTGQITRASVSAGGAQAGDSSGGASLSADGRFVAFDSYATNLVANDTNARRDAFVRDALAGGGFTQSPISLASPVAQSDEMGLEHFGPYARTDLGTGAAYTHLRTGNLVAQYSDVSIPGQGLNTVVKRTYNSGRRGIDNGLGLGWSLSVSDLDGGADGALDDLDVEGAITDLDPNAGFNVGSFGEVVNGVWQAAGFLLEFTDGDGTTHRFVRKGGPCSRWESPPGVSLRVREEFDLTGLPTAYELVRPDGVVYRAERRRCAGDTIPTLTWQVVSVRDRRANELGYCYSAFGPLAKLRLTAITHNRVGSAPVVRLDYTAAGDLDTIVSLPGLSAPDPASGVTRSWERWVDVTVDPASRQLTGVTDNAHPLPSGAIDGRRTTGFGYDPATGALSTVTDARGNPARFSYTGGRLTTVTDRRNKAWSYAYGAPDGTGAQTTTLTAPVAAGVTSTMTYRISGRGSASDGRVAGGNVVSIADAGHGSPNAPITTNYAWEANRLIRVTDGAGAATEFKYNDLGLLTEVREPPPNDPTRTDLPADAPTTAVVSTLGYRFPPNQPRYSSPCAPPSPAPGSSISTAGWCEFVAELERGAFATNISGQLRVSDFAYDDAGNLTRAVQRDAPDLAQAPSALPSAADRATTFGYYARGGLKTLDGPRTDVADITTFGTTSDATYGGYDRTGMPTSVVDAVGKTKTFTYTPYGLVSRVTDRDARITTTRYDERNNVREVTDPAGRRSDYGFDANDNKTSETTPRGTATATAGDFTTTFSYDANDWMTQRSAPGETAAAARRISTTAYFDDGTKASDTSPRPATTTYAYWPNRLVKSVTAPAGTGQSALTEHFYDAAGRASRTVHPPTNAAGSRPETQRTYTPDGDVAVERETSAVAGQLRTTRFARNAHKETVQTRGPRTVGGVEAESVDVYDRFGQPRQSRHRLDASRYIDVFNGYDLAGNQISNKQATGTGAHLEATYRFDALNRLAAQTSDPVNPGHTVDYTYFGEGQQHQRIDKVNGTTVRSSAYAYNPDNTQRALVMSDHDDAGNVTATLASCNYAPGAAETSGYDPDGHLLVSRTVSGTTGCAGGTTQRTQTFTYDDRGWMRDSTQTLRSPQTGADISRSQSYFYEADGERASVLHNGLSTSYVNSPAGWNEKVTDWRGRQSTTTYRPSGAPAEQLLNGGAIKASFDYHADGMPSSLTWARRNALGTYDSVRSHTGITYDVGGLRTAEQVSVVHPASAPLTASTGGQATLSHDLLDRLTSWKSPFSEPLTGQPTTTYSLDDGGNIVEERVVAGAVQQSRITSTYTNGRLTSRTKERTGETTKSETLTYNSLGEEDSRKSSGAVAVETDTATSYDPAGHTKTVDDRRPVGTTESPVVDVDYVYDTADRVISRVERPVSGEARTTLYFYWGTGGSLAEEADGLGNAMVRYLVDADGEHMAQESWRKADGTRAGSATWAWLLPDASGNTATHLGDDGTVLEQLAYDPYGKPDKPGTTKANESKGSTVGFQGAITDKVTKGVLLGARIYDPTTARFTTPDTFVAGEVDLALGTDELTGNRYLFAAANPTAFYDDGHWPTIKAASAFRSIKKLAKAAVPALGFVPIVGTAIDVVSAATGRDLLNGGQKLSGAERLMLLGGAALDVVSGGVGGKALKGARLAAKAVDKASTAKAAVKAASKAGRVTASGGEDLTRVGRWMSQQEFDQMSKTGRVVEGGGGRTYVVRPPNPDAYPAGKGIYAEFDVPTRSLHPASKPEWAVIPGPNAGTRRYGRLPSKMPRATCIKLVCRR